MRSRATDTAQGRTAELLEWIRGSEESERSMLDARFYMDEEVYEHAGGLDL